MKTKTKKEKLTLEKGEIITLKKNVVISDPCYSVPTIGQYTLENLKPGKYHTFVVKSDERYWGTRCSRLIVIHEDHIGENHVWVLLSEIEVGSGQAGIFSKQTYRKDGMKIKTPEIIYDGTVYNLPIEEDGDDWYLKMCKMTLSKNQWGTYKNGVVSSSGIGDGGYPVFGCYSEELSSGKVKPNKSNLHIVGICIDFLLSESNTNESLTL